MTQTIIALRHFAHEHDNLPAFHAGYLVLTLLVAMLLNMGAFGLLILAHMSLDVVKYREVHGYSWKKVLEGTVRESLLDVTLLFVGITFAIYLHHSVVGMASLSGFMRAEVTMVRGVGMLIPKIEILHKFLKIIAHVEQYLAHVHPNIHKGWNSLERLCFVFLAVTVGLLIIAPWILNLHWGMLQGILLEELIPWRV